MSQLSLRVALFLLVVLVAPAQAQTYFWPACLGPHGPAKCKGLLDPTAYAVTIASLPTGIPAVNIAAGTVTNVVFGYLANVTGDIQAQFAGKQAASSELSAIAAVSGTGLLARTGPGAYAARTLTGTTEVVVSNGSGGLGNPSVSLGSTLTNKLLTTSNSAATAFEVAEVPGSGSVKLRVYGRGSSGWYLTMNASTSDATTWTKDDSTQASSVLSFIGNPAATLQAAFENNTSNSTWTAATRSIRWNGTRGWFINTGTFQQFAWTGGSYKSCTVGAVLHFPVQWPVPFDATPTNITFGTVTSSGVDITSIAMGTTDNSGGVVTITCNANADAYWVGKISAGS